ncbi:MAG: hypothetical protein ACJAYC_001167 [Halieaceae bacterium]|jgi:hypothetical protein
MPSLPRPNVAQPEYTLDEYTHYCGLHRDTVDRQIDGGELRLASPCPDRTPGRRGCKSIGISLETMDRKARALLGMILERRLAHSEVTINEANGLLRKELLREKLLLRKKLPPRERIRRGGPPKSPKLLSLPRSEPPEYLYESDITRDFNLCRGGFQTPETKYEHAAWKRYFYQDLDGREYLLCRITAEFVEGKFSGETLTVDVVGSGDVIPSEQFEGRPATPAQESAPATIEPFVSPQRGNPLTNAIVQFGNNLFKESKEGETPGWGAVLRAMLDEEGREAMTELECKYDKDTNEFFYTDSNGKKERVSKSTARGRYNRRRRKANKDAITTD